MCIKIYILKWESVKWCVYGMVMLDVIGIVIIKFYLWVVLKFIKIVI